MTDVSLPTQIAPAERILTAPEYHRLANVPPEIEWFANLTNRNTRRAYEKAVGDFMRFTGINRPEEFRTVTRAHVIAWRDDLASNAHDGSTVRHRLAALASLFEYLCEKNAGTRVILKNIWRRILNNKWRNPAAMFARKLTASDRVRRCGQAGSRGCDIPTLAWWPSS